MAEIAEVLASLDLLLNSQLKFEVLLFMITAIYSLPGADGPGGGGAAMKKITNYERMNLGTF